MNDIYIQVKQGGTPPVSGIYVTGRTGSITNTPDNFQVNMLNLLYKEYNPTMVAQGNGFIFFIDGGRLFSVGSNVTGQTGQGTATGVTLFPTQIGSYTDWTWVACGSNYGAAIRAGRLYTWGSNATGQTGQGTNAGNTLSPTQIGSDTDWTRVSCSLGLTVAIKGGKLLSCGSNPSGRLGQNLGPSSGTIVNVFTELNGGSTGWTDCSAGVTHFLAIKNNVIWGAGATTNGRLGNGSTAAGSIIDTTQFDNTQTWVNVYAGNETSFAITSGGALYGTGNQDNGALGNNTTGNLGNFTQIGSDTDWQKIATYPGNLANYNNTAIARKGGKIWVTGNNTGGALGLTDPTTITTWTKLSEVTVQDISVRTYGSTLSII